jgi:restriction system protein
MRGFGPRGATPRGALPAKLVQQIKAGRSIACLALSSLIIPEQQTSEGVLVRSTAAVWHEIVRHLGNDWSVAFRIPWDKWEEIVAGAFKEAKYDEVTLTPRSGDHGRDVIAVKQGVGCVRILGSVKAYRPDHLVSYDDVRALAGVLATDLKASKGIIATTSDFPTNIYKEPSIAPLLHTRLELMPGEQLLRWLTTLQQASGND